MKVCVTATAPGLDAYVDPRFGRCQCFTIVDLDTMEFESVENPNITALGGAGIQSAQLVANRGAGVVLTGNVGPNAFNTFTANRWPHGGGQIRYGTGCSRTAYRIRTRFSHRSGRSRYGSRNGYAANRDPHAGRSILSSVIQGTGVADAQKPVPDARTATGADQP